MQPIDVIIPCEPFFRACQIPHSIPDIETRSYLRSVFIERRNNTLKMISTNVKIAIVENLGNSPGPDVQFALTAVAPLMQLAESIKEYNGTMRVIVNDLLKVTTVSTNFGQNYEYNAFVDLPAKNKFQGWRKWLPDAMPSQSYGAMFSDARKLEMLARSAPTGMIVFPAVIDVRASVVVRDVNDDNWLGVFVPSSFDDETGEIKYHTGATLPEWL